MKFFSVKLDLARHELVMIDCLSRETKLDSDAKVEGKRRSNATTSLRARTLVANILMYVREERMSEILKF